MVERGGRSLLLGAVPGGAGAGAQAPGAVRDGSGGHHAHDDHRGGSTALAAARHAEGLSALPATAAGAIELLQWALPLGRVVSPVDAALDATGALVAVLVVSRLREWRARPGVPA